MQFEPEESGEERRRRQRDYHDFLDAQVEARRKHPPTATREGDAPDGADRLPVLPLSARLRYQQSMPPFGVDSSTNPKEQDGKCLGINEGRTSELGGRHHQAESGSRDELLGRIEQRLEAEIQRRYLVERKLAVVSQKLENWMADSTTSLNSLGARDTVVTEIREQTRNLDSELARMQEWQNRVDATLTLAPKVQEMTQQQVKALEEEARTRIKADEARSTRFHQAVERVSGEVDSLARRLEAEERATLPRVAKMEAALAREATGAREATKQLGAEVQGLEADVSGSEKQMSSLLQSLRLIEKRQQEQHSAATEAKHARDEREQLREQVTALNAAVSVSESKMSSLVQGLRVLERWQQEQQSSGAGRPEGQVSRQELQTSVPRAAQREIPRLCGYMSKQNTRQRPSNLPCAVQESLMAATSVKLDLLRTSLADELSELMGDTAKRAVESTNVPQLMTALRSRVELAEGRLNNVADKSLGALEDELSGVRAEVTRLEDRIDAGPIATGLKVLALSTKSAQAAAQSQLTELQDALSAEITARRRNAVRLAEAQAAMKEGGRESAVQAVSGLRARCLELEELVARLTREIQTAQEDLSSQTQTKLAATQERNSRALGKLEESLAGIRTQVAQQGDNEDRNLIKVVARVDQLETVITGNKDMLREAEERARVAFAAMEAKRQEQANQFADKIAGVASGEMGRIEAIELDFREQGRCLKEALEANQHTNRRRTEGIHDEVKSLEGRLRMLIADAQEEESARVGSTMQQTQEQVNRDIARVRQTTDRNATEITTLRERINAEEVARMDGDQGLHRELSKSGEASQSRVRLWAEDRLRKERAATEESLERAHAQSEMVRTLLDEAVKAVSKELEILRAESTARNVALEDSLDERTLELQARLTEVDDGAVKKRRVSELKQETGARIGEVERRVRQVDQELKRELEVKLALSSLVCAVSDKASTERLEQTSSEVMLLEKTRKAGATQNEASLKAELQKTNATVAKMQAEINAAQRWQMSMEDLEAKLMARIEELKAMAEAAESTAAIAKIDASAALETGEKNALALEEAAKHKADTASEATLDAEKAADAGGAEKEQAGQLAKKAPAKKVMDFAAMNDELEAEESPSSSPASSSRSSATSDEDGDHKSNDADGSDLQPRVTEIEEELVALKQRLEDGIAAMEALRQEFLTAGSAVSTTFPTAEGVSSRDRAATGVSGSREIADGELRVHVDNKAPLSPASADASRGVPPSPASGASYTPPMSPTSGASYTPPLSPKSDVSDATGQGQRGFPATESQGQGDTGSSGSEKSEASGSDSGSDAESDSQGEEEHSSPGSADEAEPASQLGQEDRASRGSDEGENSDEDDASSARPESASGPGSPSGSEENNGSSSGEDDDGDGSVRDTEDGGFSPQRGRKGGDSDPGVASTTGSASGSQSSDESRSRGRSDGTDEGRDDITPHVGESRDPMRASTSGGASKGAGMADGVGSDASQESDEQTEGSVTPRGSSDSTRSSDTESEDDEAEGSEASRSKTTPPRSRRQSSSGDESPATRPKS